MSYEKPNETCFFNQAHAINLKPSMNALSRQVDDREYVHIASGIWLAAVNSNDSVTYKAHVWLIGDTVRVATRYSLYGYKNHERYDEGSIYWLSARWLKPLVVVLMAGLILDFALRSLARASVISSGSVGR